METGTRHYQEYKSPAARFAEASKRIYGNLDLDTVAIGIGCTFEIAGRWMAEPNRKPEVQISGKVLQVCGRAFQAAGVVDGVSNLIRLGVSKLNQINEEDEEIMMQQLFRDTPASIKLTVADLKEVLAARPDQVATQIQLEQKTDSFIEQSVEAHFLKYLSDANWSAAFFASVDAEIHPKVDTKVIQNGKI